MTNTERELITNYIKEVIAESVTKKKYFNARTIYSDIKRLDGVNNIPTYETVKRYIKNIIKENYPGYINEAYTPSTYLLAHYDFILNNFNPVKNKNILSVGDSGLQYDFIKKEWNGNLDNLKFNSYKGETYLNAYKELIEYEWIFNYINNDSIIDNLAELKPLGVLNKMPSNLLDIMKHEGEEYASYDTFLYAIFGRQSGNFIHRYGVSMYNKVVHTIGIKTLIKILKNSIDNLDTGCTNYIEDFINHCATLSLAGVDTQNFIDTNRDMKYNLKIVETLAQQKSKEALESQMRRLNFINGLTYNDYIVVVPQTQEEKIDEGNQQHNCVGTYYNKSILNGENLIYFIRHKDDKTKSYITCRYSIVCKDTVEYRRIYNSRVDLPQDLEFIKMVSDLIRANLK